MSSQPKLHPSSSSLRNVLDQLHSRCRYRRRGAVAVAHEPLEPRQLLSVNLSPTGPKGVEGVTAVVDSGLARVLLYDPAVGLDRLKLMPVSRASADQRAGRAGRTRPAAEPPPWRT